MKHGSQVGDVRLVHPRISPELRTAYSGLSDPDLWVLPLALREHAERRPNAPWITVIDGDHCTFGEMWLDARRVATWFAERGVSAGDGVVLMLPNGLDFVRAWLGLGLLGAVAVLLNPELHGAFLEHQLRSSGARFALIDGDVAGAFANAAPVAPSLTGYAIAGDASIQIELGQHTWTGDRGWRGARPYDVIPPASHHAYCVMFTSGTGGASKGVVMPHAHCTLYGLGTLEAFQVQDDDSYYISLPLFHANGLLMQLGATLLAGIPAVVKARFSPSGWLRDIRKHGATLTNTLGALAGFIVSQHPTDQDRDHKLRGLLSAPNLEVHETIFRNRFGVRDVISGYGMTEVNIPVWGRLGSSNPGTAGFLNKQYFDLIIADPETDREVPYGQVGEILVRPKVAGAFMAGYHGMPDKTVEAWRNLWFHTGDAGIIDAVGLLVFVDRLKDCIRRRAENISASEVEAVILQLPEIQEVAAYAVPSPSAGAEDEVMLAIVKTAAAGLDEKSVLAHADASLPRFAQPRFVRFVESLPKTATGKVQRAVLRSQGSVDAFDRERAKPPRA